MQCNIVFMCRVFARFLDLMYMAFIFGILELIFINVFACVFVLNLHVCV